VLSLWKKRPAQSGKRTLQKHHGADLIHGIILIQNPAYKIVPVKVGIQIKQVFFKQIPDPCLPADMQVGDG